MFSKFPRPPAHTVCCPECGAAPEGKPARGIQVITCVACGTKASRAEWTRLVESHETGQPDTPPTATRIHRENGPDGTLWHITERGKFGFFFYFGLCWTLFTALTSGLFLFAFLSGEEIKSRGPHPAPDWFLIPFFGLFWGVGMTILYFGLREKYLVHELAVKGGALILRRELFGRSREKKLPVSEILSIGQKEFHQQNRRPVHGIEIKASHGKLRFGSTLDPGDKAWLVAELRNSVFGAVSSPTMPVEGGATPPPASGNPAFSVEIPNASKHLWPIAIALGVVGTIFSIAARTFFRNRMPGAAADDPLLVRIFDSLFEVIPLVLQVVFTVVGAAMVIGSVVLLIQLLRGRGTVRKLEGNSVEIAVRTYRHHRVVDERTFPRRQITDIRASQSGNSGETVMKRLEFIAGDEVINIASWIPAADADAVVGQVRPCL